MGSITPRNVPPNNPDPLVNAALCCALIVTLAATGLVTRRFALAVTLKVSDADNAPPRTPAPRVKVALITASKGSGFPTSSLVTRMFAELLALNVQVADTGVETALVNATSVTAQLVALPNVALNGYVPAAPTP
jgi:hypothetical protein